MRGESIYIIQKHGVSCAMWRCVSEAYLRMDVTSSSYANQRCCVWGLFVSDNIGSLLDETDAMRAFTDLEIKITFSDGPILTWM